MQVEQIIAQLPIQRSQSPVQNGREEEERKGTEGRLRDKRGWERTRRKGGFQLKV